MKLQKLLNLILLEDSIKLDDLLIELRSLPDDLPPFNLDYAHEMPNEMIKLLEKSANWMKQLWPLFLMLSEVNIQQPGALSDDDDYNFGSHEDMIP